MTFSIQAPVKRGVHPPVLRRGVSSAVARVFAKGRQGFATDFNDLSLVSQDTSGVTPVTAFGQAVGRIGDASGNGNHAELQIVGGNATFRTTPVLGEELAPSSAWGTPPTGVSANPSTGVITFTAAAASYALMDLNAGYAAVVGAKYSIKFTVTNWVAGGGHVRLGNVNNYVSGNGVYEFLITATTAEHIFIEADLNGWQADISGISVRLAVGSKRGRNYLNFGGNARFRTGPIDFSGVDSVTVIAAIANPRTGTSDFGPVVELSDVIGNNAGSFLLCAPSWSVGSTNIVGFASRGTAGTVEAQAGTSGQEKLVLVGKADISADICSISVNGATPVNNSADQGSGNFGATYSLNIGGRPGTGWLYSGDIYALCVIAGSITDAELAAICDEYAGALNFALP